MNTKSLREQKLAFERSALLDALVTTTTQMAAAEKLGYTPAGLTVLIARHPGIKDEAKTAQAKALADWSVNQ